MRARLMVPWTDTKATGTELHVFQACSGWTVRAFTPDSKTGECREIGRVNNGYFNDLSFSPDGLMLASITGLGTVQVWDMDSGKERVILELIDASEQAW
jgi:WD40 repeat protein